MRFADTHSPTHSLHTAFISPHVVLSPLFGFGLPPSLPPSLPPTCIHAPILKASCVPAGEIEMTQGAVQHIMALPRLRQTTQQLQGQLLHVHMLPAYHMRFADTRSPAYSPCAAFFFRLWTPPPPCHLARHSTHPRTHSQGLWWPAGEFKMTQGALRCITALPRLCWTV